MWFPLAIALLGLLLLLLYRHIRISTLLRDMADSLDAGRPYLVDRQSRFLRSHPVSRVLRRITEIQEENASVSRLQAGHLHQIQVTLGNIQESVFILDPGNYIILANQAAREVLSDGQNLNGRRLESVIRSSALLEFVDGVKSGELLGRTEIQINRERGPLWFEVSGTVIADVDTRGDQLALFVLHDISRLKHLETVRKEFVANVSHELRTPLTIIKGYTDTVLEDLDELPREATQRFLSKIQFNVNRLNLLIEDLLALSRLESQQQKINREPVSLRNLLEEVKDGAEEMLDSSKQAIVLRLDLPSDEVAGDRLKLQQVFQNLLDNAIRYATGFTEIEIAARALEDSEMIEVSVNDNGAGIPEADLPHVFERFYRVDKGRSRETGGTGLGLSIVKHIVQLHGGEVSVKSEVGQGTSMVLTLPMANANQALQPELMMRRFPGRTL